MPKKYILTFTTLWAIQQTKIDNIFLIYLRKQDLIFHTNCLHCMKCQILFSVKKEKYFNMSSAETFTQSAKH